MLITLEGLDYAGKSTLMDSLKSLYPDAMFVHAHDTEIGRWLRENLHKPMHNTTKLFLFSAVINEFCKTVLEPNEGKTIFVDRFIDSTFAYQGGGDQTNLIHIVRTMLMATEKTNGERINPDLTFYIDISVSEMNRRRSATGARNSLDELSLEFYERVKSLYDTIAQLETNRVVTINGEQTPDEVFNDAVEALIERGYLKK